MGVSSLRQQSKNIALNQSKFAQIKEKLCLENQNIQDLYEYFRKFDRFDRAYVDFDDFIAHFRSNIENFVELPYAERLYKCIPKQHQTKVFFEEFIMGISAFCLLNNQSLLHFIFDLIDIDGDQKISKKDIMKLIKYTDPLSGKQTFFTNFSADLQEFPMKEKQNKMDFDHFRLNSDRLMFLIWPAFSLQQYLREKILGANFWSALYSKVEKKQIEIKNNEKKQQRMNEKMEMLKNIKNRRVEIYLMKDKVNERKYREVADDTKLFKRLSKPRRRSVLYLKQEMQINNMENQNSGK